MINMSSIPSAAGFPEALLDVRLPDYEQERFWLWIKLAGVAFFFLILLPPMFATEVGLGNDEKTTAKSTTEANASAPVTTSKKNAKGAKGSKKSLKTKGTAKQNDAKGKPETKEPEFEITQNVVMFCCAAFMMAVVAVMVKSSPDNYYTPRGVFQAPLLTQDECQHILAMADAAAQRNYEHALEVQENAHAENAKIILEGGEAVDLSVESEEENELMNKTVKGLLLEPQGWQKFRHNNYPTTDLNIITDPFTMDDQRYLKEKLDARLGPLLERIFGVPASSIRANDMFVVRYDAGMRTRLTNHTDDGHISFNVLLNDDFEGGGTRFWNRHSEKPFAHVQPTQVGQVLTHSAEVNHEGMHVSRGTRTILVGFLSVDRVDPFTGRWTGLPWLGSWGSLSWSMIKFKHGFKAADVRMRATGEKVWWNHPSIVSFFVKVYQFLMSLGDIGLPHFVADLVSEENRPAYLASLDAAYEQRKEHRDTRNLASWFQGQQISVDINGVLAGEWNTRKASSYRFSSIEL